MPMYMDIHEVSGATAADVAKAHIADVKTQGKYGVVYHKYWLNESNGKIFCLCSAPNPEAAASVHREAHGLVASKIIEVAPEIADGFLGGSEVNPAGAALLPGGQKTATITLKPNVAYNVEGARASVFQHYLYKPVTVKLFAKRSGSLYRLGDYKIDQVVLPAAPGRGASQQ